MISFIQLFFFLFASQDDLERCIHVASYDDIYDDIYPLQMNLRKFIFLFIDI